MSTLARDWREFSTFSMRLAYFAVTLVVIGAFFLPWIRLDGENQARSGAELTTLIVSPTFDYLSAVSPIQTGVLIGCPTLAILAAIMVMTKYARRKTAIFSTVVVLASAIAIIYATPELTTSEEPRVYSGLSLVIVLSVVLLLHQSLIKLRTKLLSNRRFPIMYRVLSIVTGSGLYRWNEGKTV